MSPVVKDIDIDAKVAVTKDEFHKGDSFSRPSDSKERRCRPSSGHADRAREQHAN